MRKHLSLLLSTTFFISTFAHSALIEVTGGGLATSSGNIHSPPYAITSTLAIPAVASGNYAISSDGYAETYNEDSFGNGYTENTIVSTATTSMTLTESNITISGRATGSSAYISSGAYAYFTGKVHGTLEFSLTKTENFDYLWNMGVTDEYGFENNSYLSIKNSEGITVLNCHYTEVACSGQLLLLLGDYTMEYWAEATRVTGTMSDGYIKFSLSSTTEVPIPAASYFFLSGLIPLIYNIKKRSH